MITPRKGQCSEGMTCNHFLPAFDKNSYELCTVAIVNNVAINFPASNVETGQMSFGRECSLILISYPSNVMVRRRGSHCLRQSKYLCLPPLALLRQFLSRAMHSHNLCDSGRSTLATKGVSSDGRSSQTPHAGEASEKSLHLHVRKPSNNLSAR